MTFYTTWFVWSHVGLLTTICSVVLPLLSYVIGHRAKRQGDRNTWIKAHFMWHLSSGVACSYGLWLCQLRARALAAA